MQETHHSHPVDIHLSAGIVQGAELQRPADSHAGVVDKDVDAPLGLDDLGDRSLDLGVIGGVRLDVDNPG